MTSNTEPQVITSPLFSSRGSWPEAEMKKFVIGIEAGAREKWVEAAKQAGWLENVVRMTAGSVVSCDQHGMVQGSKLFVTSGSTWATGQTANNIWPKGAKEISVAFDFPPIEFPGRGDARNISRWLDAAPFMTVSCNGNEIPEEQWKSIDGVRDGLAVRFALYPASVSKFGCQVYYYPASLSKLSEETTARKVELDSLMIPCGRLRFLKDSMRFVPALLMEPNPSTGLGQLPLIEVPDTNNYTLPSRDEVEREVCSLLGECVTLLVTANSPQQLEVILKGAWKDFTLHPKPTTWPAYPGPLEVEPAGGE